MYIKGMTKFNIIRIKKMRENVYIDNYKNKKKWKENSQIIYTSYFGERKGEEYGRVRRGKEKNKRDNGKIRKYALA